MIVGPTKVVPAPPPVLGVPKDGPAAPAPRTWGVDPPPPQRTWGADPAPTS